MRLLSLAPVAIAAAVVACAAPVTEDASGSASAQTESGATDAVRLYRDGFRLVRPKSCVDEPGGCQLALLDPRGDFVPAGDVQIARAPFTGGLAFLDRATVGACAGNPGDCYTVYQWPASIARRNHTALAEQMREYSKLVGTVLNREARGPGEERWLRYLRSDAFVRTAQAARRGATEYCGAVVKELVDSTVPAGSEFLQYGNCGEGGRIGACLAYKAGFREDEIQVCLSQNDHFFALLEHEDKAKKSCILDRWPLIEKDNYACEVEWDESNRRILHRGAPTGRNWFEAVTCVSFATFLEEGAMVQ